MQFYSTKIYVDKNTGEQITEYNAKRNYIILKKIKHATPNFKLGTCKIEYTNLCIRNPQQQLEFN